MAKFSIDDIDSLMSAVSIAYIMSEGKHEKKYWTDLANRLNDLANEMKRKRILDLMRMVTNESE